MDKATLRVLSSVLMLSMLLAFFLAFAPTASISARQPRVATPSPVHAGSTARASGSAATPAAADRSVPGSTDGIVVMSFAIVLIIVFPILLHRGLWGK